MRGCLQNSRRDYSAGGGDGKGGMWHAEARRRGGLEPPALPCVSASPREPFRGWFRAGRFCAMIGGEGGTHGQDSVDDRSGGPAGLRWTGGGGGPAGQRLDAGVQLSPEGPRPADAGDG